MMNRINYQLIQAVETGNYGDIYNLLQQRADVNFRCLGDTTPLMNVVSSGYTSIARLLIWNGASVNARDVTDCTALHCAAKANVDLCKLLLNNKAIVDAEDCDGITPLVAASYREGTTICCELLIDLQLEKAIKDKKAIITFLTMARKRKVFNYIPYDVVRMIAKEGLKTVREATIHVTKQINMMENLETETQWLHYVKTKMK